MTRLGIAAVCAALLAAGCASTGGETASLEQADAGPVTCGEILVPGSNVLESVCMTESEWDEYRRDQRRNAQAMTRRIQGMSGGF
jgi:hypothetical protein